MDEAKLAAIGARVSKMYAEGDIFPAFMQFKQDILALVAEVKRLKKAESALVDEYNRLKDRLAASEASGDVF